MQVESQPLEKKLVSGGVVFTAGAQIAIPLLQLGAIALLARMLDPGAFGLLALAVAILAFLRMIADLGLDNSCEHEERTEVQAATLLRLNLSIAAVLGIAVLFAAPLFGRLFHNTDLAWVLRALAPCFLLAGALRTRSSALAREQRFRALAGVELTAITFGALTSIGLALVGFGRTALVMGVAIHQLTWSGAVLTAAGLPKKRAFDLDSIKPFLGFGRSSTFGLVHFFTRRLDYFLVGGLMGIAALGHYGLAWVLVMLPVTRLTAVIGRGTNLVLSKARHDEERIRFLYLGAVRRIAGRSFPLAAVCVAQADPVVRLVLGPKFIDAIPIFLVLSLIMGLRPIMSSSRWVFPREKMGTFFSWGVVTGILLCGAIVFGAWRGGTPLAVAKAYAVMYAALFVPWMAITLRQAGIGMGALFNRIAVPAIAAISAYLAAWTVPTAPFPVAVAVMAAVYCVVHLLLDRRAFVDLFRIADPRHAIDPTGA